MNFERVPTKQAPCKNHKIQSFIPVSPRLAEEIKKGQKLSESDLHKVEIHSEGKIFEYIVDYDFLRSFTTQKNYEGNKFYDRDKKNKLLNDRLVIQRMVSQMQWVCIKCFTDSIREKVKVR